MTTTNTNTNTSIMKLLLNNWIHHTLTAMLITQVFLLALLLFVAYYSGTSSAWEFVEWFYPATWLVLSTLPALAVTLPVALLDAVVYKRKA